MADTGPQSLKEENRVALAAAVALNVAALAFLAWGSAATLTLDDASNLVARLAAAGITPLAVLLLSTLLTSHQKAVLVYWRWRDPLPGHQAFSVHGPSDQRVDMGRLEQHVGPLPVEPKAQNALWYRMLRRVESDPRVRAAHKHALLLRDLTALYALLIVALVPLWCFNIFSNGTFKWALGLLGGQFLLASLSAKNAGVRLVTTVLAVHASEKHM